MLYRDREDFSPTIAAAAESIGLPPIAVEKDYWLSQALRCMTTTSLSDFLFKGGTSLSKAYALIERFSEDIDILIIPGDRGPGARDALMKALGDSAAEGTGGEAKSHPDVERGTHRTRLITYPHAHEGALAIEPTIRLEMGIRGGSHPYEARKIAPLLFEVLRSSDIDPLSFEDLQPFNVHVLAPGRTLLEKLVIVHQEALRMEEDPNSQIKTRAGRHMYDIMKLLSSDLCSDVLDDKSQFDEIIEDIGRVNEQYFDGNSKVRPDDGFAASSAFELGSMANDRLKLDYEETMPDLYYGKGHLPTWAEICEFVLENKGRL